jgi:hypothetical protein
VDVGKYAKRQGVVGAVVVVRPVTPVSVPCTRFVMTPMTALEYKSNLEKAVQAAVREFFDSDVEGKIMYARQVTAKKSNASHIPLVRRDYRCWMTSDLSLGMVSHSLGHQCSLHSVNGSHPRRELICSPAIVRSLE